MDSYLVILYKDTDRKLREQPQPAYHTVTSENASALQQFLKRVCYSSYRRHNTALTIMENSSAISVNMATYPPSPSASMDVSSLPLTKNIAWAVTVILPVEALLGVFGNVMTIIIVRRFRAASSSSAMDPYFMVLAVTDLCVVITGILPSWIHSATGFYVVSTHDVVCKSLTFLLNVGVASSAWILVAMTIQRAVSVAWPHRVSVLCTRRRSWWTILTIVVFFFLAYSHMLYGVGIVPSAGYACIMTSQSYALFMLNVWVNIDMFLFSLLPFACLFLSNSVLILKLRRSVKDAGDQLTTTDTQQASREKNANSVTLTAIVVSVVFIVLTSPQAIYNTFSFKNTNTETGDVDDLALRFFLQKTFNMIGYFNYSVNFYLYCLTGEKFRKEFRKIMCE